MRIDYLEDVPEFVSLLAPAMADHWRNIIPGESYGRRYEKLISHKNRDQLPLAWVAHENGVPLGTSALRVCDLEGREDLTPWLAGIFVMPGYRVESQLNFVKWQKGRRGNGELRAYICTLQTSKGSIASWVGVV